MAIPECGVAVNNVQMLDDEPNDVGGLTAAELKAVFDKTGADLKAYINDVLLPALSGEGGAADIGVYPIYGLLAQTAQEALEELAQEITSLDDTKADASTMYTLLYDKCDKETANAHINAIDNPHMVTAEQVGLGNVDNTADADKPVSAAAAEAIAAADRIFPCIYGETSYAAILAALNAGKTPVVTNEVGETLVYSRTFLDAEFVSGHCFQSVTSLTYETTVRVKLWVCMPNSEWVSETKELSSVPPLTVVSMTTPAKDAWSSLLIPFANGRPAFVFVVKNSNRYMLPCVSFDGSSFEFCATVSNQALRVVLNKNGNYYTWWDNI